MAMLFLIGNPQVHLCAFTGSRGFWALRSSAHLFFGPLELFGMTPMASILVADL